MVATNFFAGAAVLLAAASQVSAAGSAIVRNQCPYPVYLWSIANTDTPMQTLAANGGQYTEAYRTNPNGGGVSIKMGTDTKRNTVTQFEYTYTPNDGSLWYDLSNIDGFPFEQYGVTVVLSDTGCRQVSCPAGQTKCAQAYNIPTDNFATAECGASADSVVVLCSGETDTSGSASVSSVASEAASTAVPVSSTVFTSATPATTTKASVPASSSTSSKKPAHKTHSEAAAVQNIVATTAAPATTEAPANPYVVVQTTFVTHVVTVEARSAQPTAAAKRDVHHEHAAVHAEHAVRRHAHPRAFPRK